MKKHLTAVLLFFCASSMTAQDDKVDSRLTNIDWKEDSTEIITVRDIIRTQQKVTTRAALTDHYAKVWGNRGFFNVSYHLQSTMDPSRTIPTGFSLNNGELPKQTAKYGGSILVGKNIKLHKKPIANTLAFNLDFIGVDLNFNYYDGEKADGDSVYNSKATYDVKEKGKTKTFHYIAWNQKKYQLSYGMMIGPSITLAPFNYIKDAKGLHFMKFGFYYHIGYRASALLIIGDKEKDYQYPGENVFYNTWNENQRNELEEYNENQFLVGHGLYQAWGVTMSWKRIGFGYEHCWGKDLKYKNIAGKSKFGDSSYKFDIVTNRIYLTYRFGK